MDDEIIGYKMVPVYKSEFRGMQPNATTSCFVIRKCIWGVGCRGDVMCPEVADMLKDDRIIQQLIRMRYQEIAAERRKNNAINEETGE